MSEKKETRIIRQSNPIDNPEPGQRRKFNNLTTAWNWIREYRGKKKYKAENKKKLENYKPTIAPPEHRAKYLLYGISLLSPNQYMNRDEFYRHRALLNLEVRGWTVKAIAKELKADPIKVEKEMKIAKEKVKEAISKVKANGVPIVGK